MRKVSLLLTLFLVTGGALALTDGDLSKLKPGMKTNDVRTILGAPSTIQTDSQSACEAKGQNSVSWSFNSKSSSERSYVIVFCDGKFDSVIKR